MTGAADGATWLPVVFISLMGLAFLLYAILDGYDLGVGILLPSDSEAQRDTMIASIGPFWDANETWLVLAVGLLLIAFPKAHGLVLGALYLPVALMLAGLILRGVAFDFRAKAPVDHKLRWDRAFRAGSLLATLAQGYMIGLYVVGLDDSASAHLFGALSAVCVTAGYSFIGAGWLLMKTEGELQARAARWARASLRLTALGIVAVSVVNPLVDDYVFDRWFGFPQTLLLAPVPLAIVALIAWVERYLRAYPREGDRDCWIPFAAGVLIFVLCFAGLAYSFYPWVVPGELTIWEAASAPESLRFILVGVVIVLPAILGYTVLAYRVFWGKATDLTYH